MFSTMQEAVSFVNRDSVIFGSAQEFVKALALCGLWDLAHWLHSCAGERPDTSSRLVQLLGMSQ